MERHEDKAATPDHGTQEQQEEAPESVSEVLLRAREDYGQDLRSVSDSLRIRHIYLLAIEEGRYDDLPGATYAVGFVRTYADYLGLDSQEIVRRFKAEVEGLERRTQLVFPVPKPEGKIPGGAIILISLLLVGVAYGGWYFLSQDDQSFVGLISGSSPEENQLVAGQAGSDGAPAAQPEATPSPAQPASEAPQSETPQTEAPQNSAAVETLPPDPPVEAEQLPPPGENGQAQTQPQVSSQPTTGAASQDGAPPQTAPSTGALPSVPQTSEAPEAAAAEPETMQPGGEGTTASGIPAAPQSDQVASAPTGRIFGQEEGTVRIVVRAKQDAWVQVRDAQNQLILTEVLRSGDVYRVPDEAGLSMLTGNAGGLEILVDGQVAPTLGPIGVVRRNVVLDPQRLSSGTAVGEQQTE